MIPWSCGTGYNFRDWPFELRSGVGIGGSVVSSRAQHEEHEGQKSGAHAGAYEGGSRLEGGGSAGVSARIWLQLQSVEVFEKHFPLALLNFNDAKWVPGNRPGYKHCWKRMRQLQNVANQLPTEQRPPDAFADMLEAIFNGNPGAPTQPEQLDESLRTLEELTFAIEGLFFLNKRLENNKAADECGLVAPISPVPIGGMLSAAGSKHATLDVDDHLQSAGRAFFANK